MLVNKETGKPLTPGSTDGFLESFAEGFDPNADPQSFEQGAQQIGTTPATMDDDDYFMNQ
jgi:hypothetical protein